MAQLADDDDSDLARAYAEAAGVPSGAHVHEDVWAQLATGEIGADERARAFDHIAACAECAALYRDVAALRNEAPRLGVPVVAPFGERRTARPVRWLLAGASAAAAVLLVALWPRGVAPPKQPASSPGEEVRSGQTSAPVPLAPRGRVTGAPAAFRWDAAPDARGYRVELLTAKSELVWASDEVASTGLPWPAQVTPASGRYYWHVGAIPSWSRSPADVVWSPLVAIELAP